MTNDEDETDSVVWPLRAYLGWVRRRGDRARAGAGPDPKLPPPRQTLFPKVKIAPPNGWSTGAKPTPAAGPSIAALASGLDHPRWLTILLNGDVVIAETNTPPEIRTPRPAFRIL